MLFWLLATAVVAAITVILARAALDRGRAGDAVIDPDLQVYRDQLAEVDRDLARGVIGSDDAARSRAEISQRILGADRARRRADTGDRDAPQAATYGLIGATAVLLAGAGFFLYPRIGAPGYPDLPIALRITLAEDTRLGRANQADAAAEAARLRGPALPIAADFADLMDKLRLAVAERPGDLQGLALLARNEAAIGNFAAAIAAQNGLIQAKATTATAEDYATLADLMVVAAAGYVTPEAEAAADAALSLDPANGTARYYRGLMLAQTGRPDLAFGIWRALLEDSPVEAPWVPIIAAKIDELARIAGVDYAAPTPTPAPKGPSAGDIAAAAGMNDADRQAMIRTMVEGLADRLAADGGPAEDWARLIAALGVLGEADRARAIWTEAQGVFAGNVAAMDLVRAAALQAGVTE